MAYDQDAVDAAIALLRPEINALTQEVAAIKAHPDQSRASFTFQARLFAALAESNDPTAIWERLSQALDQGN